MGLSNVLNKLMRERNINSLQLSRYVNVPVTNIVRMRKDDNVSPKTSSLKAISEFFNISVDQLLGIKELPSHKQEGIHNAVNYTAALLPVINWVDVIPFTKDPEAFLKGKILKWVSSTREFQEGSYAVIIPDDARALFLKKDSLILMEPLKRVKKNGIVLLAENDKEINLYKVILDGKEAYIKSLDPEIKGLKLLPDSFTLLGSIAEIRYELQEDHANSLNEAKRIMPFNTSDILVTNET